MSAKRLFASFALTVLAGCTSISPRTSVDVGYYDVKGTTFKQLDQQIALHGPFVKGVGKAVASTSISMLPDIRFKETDKGCAVSKAEIMVKAKVLLPKLSDRRKASAKLRPAFSNIEDYAKKHESVHVSIADSYARKAEQAIISLAGEKNCDLMKSKTISTYEAVMVKHRAAQLKFDADEQRRFAKLEKAG